MTRVCLGIGGWFEKLYNWYIIIITSFRVRLCVCTPYDGGMFKLQVHNSFICNLTDTFMFRFNVTFEEPK